MKKKNIIMSVFVLCLLTGCFVPGNEATITINLAQDSRAAMPWPPDDPDNNILKDIDYAITLSGNGDTKTFEAKGGDTIKTTVFVGLWNVLIDAYYQGKHYATGSNSVDVKAGRSNTVTVQLDQIHIVKIAAYIILPVK